jgi:hypothetical protein
MGTLVGRSGGNESDLKHVERGEFERASLNSRNDGTWNCGMFRRPREVPCLPRSFLWSLLDL